MSGHDGETARPESAPTAPPRREMEHQELESHEAQAPSEPAPSDAPPGSEASARTDEPRNGSGDGASRDEAAAGEATAADSEAAAAAGAAASSEAAAAGELSAASTDRTPPAAGSSKTKKRLLFDLLLFIVGGAVPFCIMATGRHFRFSVPIGFVGVLVASCGILDAFRLFDDPAERVQASNTARALLPRLSELIASSIVLLGLMTLAVAGVYPAPVVTAAIVIPIAFLWVVTATFRMGRALGAWHDTLDDTDSAAVRPLLQRHGFWLVALLTLLYLPMLGSYSLSDPWETHYGEVAREMLARDDWISLWWAQDGWFWSKPILDFWIQGLWFSLLGVEFMPDEMIRGVTEGRFPQPEWAARMPVFLITLLAVYVLYRAVAKVWGRRVGFLAGVVLTTLPYWFLIGHQTMTDMPYVGTLTVSMALLLLAFSTDPEQKARQYELSVGKRTLRLSGVHLLLFAVLLTSLPQILYLASLNFTLHLGPELYGFQLHPDQFGSGSGGGNCGLPGNQPCRPTEPRYDMLQPLLMAGIWTLGLGFLIWLKRKERRLQRFYFMGAWYFMALSVMAKGAPGLVLPIFCTLAFIFATRRWKDLERLEPAALILLVACVALPWYVQMYLRHGHPFVDRLIMHDMYKRAFVHVHDTNQGDDVSFRYYVWQLGYGLFPWTGLAAGGLVWWLRRPDRTPDGQGQGAALMALWFIAAFGMFTITLTKFHHYIFPLVPPTAVLTAIVVDRFFDKGSPAKPGALARYAAGIGAGMMLFVYGFIRLFPRQLDGDAYAGAPPWKGWGVIAMVVGFAVAAAAIWRFGRRELAPSSEPVPARERYDRTMLALLGLVSAVAVALAGRDMFVTMPGDLEGQIRLMQLFTYNYRRPWPDALDFTGALIAFTAVATILSLAWVWIRGRRHVTALFAATAALFTAWGVNIYLVALSPHWGQRETVMAYYQDRDSPDQPLVAYQMNWKGENFYTGNRIPAFVSTGKRFRDWVDQKKQSGTEVMYFTTEHSRIRSLKRELGDPKKFQKITNKKLNNKFFVARVEF